MTEITYGRYKTRAAAEAALEDCFATGKIFECERPTIEKRGAIWCLIVRYSPNFY